MDHKSSIAHLIFIKNELGQKKLIPVVLLLTYLLGTCATTPTFIGTYGARLPDTSSPGGVIHLTLSADQRAEMSTDFLNNKPVIVESAVSCMIRDDFLYISLAADSGIMKFAPAK